MNLPFALPRLSWRMVGGIAVGIAVLAALGAGAWLWSASQQRQAAVAYAEVLGRLTTPTGQPLPAEVRAAAERDLESALARYPSGALAGQAAYALGNLKYADRDYARARAAYEVARVQAGSRTIRTLAGVGIGYSWEAERNLPKAIEAYQAAAAELRPADFQYEDLLIDLARVQELAGRRDEAIQTYRRVLRDVPKGLRSDDVLTRLAALGGAP